MMSKVEVVGVEIERADNDRKPVAVTIYRYDDGDYVGRRHYLTEASRGRLAQWLDVTPAVIIRDIAESPAPAGVTPATVEDSSAAELPVNEAIAAELAGLVTELHNVYEEIGIDTFAYWLRHGAGESFLADALEDFIERHYPAEWAAARRLYAEDETVRSRDPQPKGESYP